MGRNNNPFDALKDANVPNKFIDTIASKLDSPKAQSLLGFLGVDKETAIDSLNSLSHADNSEPKVQDSDIEKLRRGLRNM